MRRRPSRIARERPARRTPRALAAHARVALALAIAAALLALMLRVLAALPAIAQEGTPLEPTTEGAPVVPTTEGGSIEPTTESEPVVPTTESAPLEPTTEGAPIEPPPEGVEGQDYEYEPADTLDDDALEVGVGASARPGEAPRRTRRVRFRGDGMRGAAREGGGDALAGATVDGAIAGGAMRVGRLAPRWGRGLVLGAAADPWGNAARDRGSGAAFRGRAGEGAAFRRARGGASLELMAGRFARRQLAGGGFSAGGFGLGALGARGGRGQGSVSLLREPADLEFAMDAGGRWRAEGALVRPFEDGVLVLRARGGLAAFRSLAEPRRSGPAQALATDVRRASGPWRLAASGALWRFRPQVAGARGALEVDRDLAEHGALILGLEEQHGARREPPSRAAGFRQGLWGEWRATAPGLALALRHEVWGERAVLRAAVRAVTIVRIDAGASPRPTIRLTHAVFRVRSGETVYLPEAGSDRLVLRALSGAGARTRLELGLPAGGGALRATLEMTAAADKPPRLLWTFDWTRRARTRTAPTYGPPPDP